MNRLWQQAGMLVVLVLLLVLSAAFVPNFTKWENVKGLLLAVSLVGMISCTMLFCLAGGDFDLSVGSTVALAGVMAALVINKYGNAPLALIIPIAAGAAIGSLNGFVIARIGINALITTLATMQIVRGIAYLISNGSSIGVFDKGLTSMATWSVGGLQASVYYMIALFAAFGFLLNRTVFGRNTLAIGGNAEASRLAGLPVVKTKVLIFMLQGAVAAFAGVILAARVSSGNPDTAKGLELQVISSCVLGGVSLTGGIGTISGMIVGVLIMGVVQNAMSLLNIDAFWQLVASGVVLLAAVMLDRLKSKSA